MFDTPPWLEIGAAALSTGLAVLWLLFGPGSRRDVLAPWVAATAFTLVAVNAAPMGLLFAAGATLATAGVPDLRLRFGLFAIGAAATVAVMTREIDSELIVGALLGTAVAAAGLWYCDRLHGRPVSVILIAGTAFGIYINVPDTEQIVVLATALPLLAAAMLAFRSLRTSPVSFESLAVIAALVMASGAVGARGRTESFIGALGALGVLVGEPIAATIRRRTRSYGPVIAAVHAAAVIVASRVAGRHGPWSLRTTVVITIVAATVALTVLPRKRLE